MRHRNWVAGEPWQCCLAGGRAPAGTTAGCRCGTRLLPAIRTWWAATPKGWRRWWRLPDGRVVTGGWDQRVVVWDPAQASVVQLACSVIALAAAPLGLEVSLLVIAHEGTGFSVWSIMK